MSIVFKAFIFCVMVLTVMPDLFGGVAEHDNGVDIEKLSSVFCSNESFLAPLNLSQTQCLHSVELNGKRCNELVSVIIAGIDPSLENKKSTQIHINLSYLFVECVKVGIYDDALSKKDKIEGPE